MIWDVDLRKTLRHGDSRFELAARFASDARRVVLFGPSGAGKTQTLRAIAGISAPDAGLVRLRDRLLYDSGAGISLSPQARRLGYVFQDYALFPHLSVRQNIAFATRSGWRNPSRRTRHEAVDRWIEAFRLQGHVDHLPHQISGGQRQRTALARALVNQPQALLLDEPFAALDRPLRERLREELLELLARLELPMLLITHDDEDVAVLGEHVIEMAGGRVHAARASALE